MPQVRALGLELNLQRRKRKTSHSKTTTSDYEHLVNHIDGLYRCADTAEKLIIGGGIFSFQNWWRPEETMLADRC